MVLEGRFEYSKALILTPDRIKELENIFLKYCKYVTFKATTVAETEISFFSADELLMYDNFQNRRIKSLTAYGQNENAQVVSCTFEATGPKILVGYDKICLCRYTVSAIDEETTLRNEILTYLKKATARFWILGKIRLLGIFFVLCCLGTIYFLGNGISNTGSGTESAVFSLLLSFILSILIVLIIIMFDQYILNSLFPPISFLWGEEKYRFKRYQEIRKNIFWGVIIATIVGIFVFYITNYLPI